MGYHHDADRAGEQNVEDALLVMVAENIWLRGEVARLKAELSDVITLTAMALHEPAADLLDGDR